MVMHNADTNVNEASLKDGYEVSDINATIVVMFLFVLALMTAAGFIAIIIVLRGMDAAVPEKVEHPMTQQMQARVEASGPKLQMNPPADRRELEAKQEARLHSYGILSDAETKRVAHIPIEKAMELVATGAVPYRQEPTQAKTGSEESAPGENASKNEPAEQ